MEKEIKNTLTKFRISEEEFREMVVARRMSDVAIGKQLGVCSVTVQHWRKKFGIAQPFERMSRVIHTAQRSAE